MAFVLQLGERDEVKTAAEPGLHLSLVFPVITDQPLMKIKFIPDWYISEPIMTK
jgi:hypothetical protein